MGKLRAWLKQKVSDPLLALLTRGLSPQDLSLAVVVSLGLGINPIIGSTSVVCLVAGRLFRLNHLVMQTVNYLVYPLQFLLLVPFVRLGEMIAGAEALPLSPSLLGKACCYGERCHGGPSNRFLRGRSGLRA